MTSELLLVVCSANVCRSPLAELLLRRGLEGVSGVRVGSAGVAASDGARMCTLAGAQHDDASWRETVAAHRSRRVTDGLLQLATLVLAADRDVRSDVVRATPEIRNRVFTLRDAARLVEAVPLEVTAHRVGVVSRLAMHLDQNRAIKDVRHVPRGLLRSRRGGDLSSVADGHSAGPRKHRAAVDEVAVSVGSILTALAPGPSSWRGAER